MASCQDEHVILGEISSVLLSMAFRSGRADDVALIRDPVYNDQPLVQREC
jgi:hypothetical protein